MKRKLLYLLPLFALLMSCNLFTPAAISTATPLPIPTDAPPEPTWTDIPDEPTPLESTPGSPDPLANCPTAPEGQMVFTWRENGFCFVVPDGYRVETDGQRPEESVMLVGPTESGDQMERATVLLWIANNGPADGLTGETYGVRWHERFVGALGPLTAEPATIGGQPALVLREIATGMIVQQGAFVVANGFKYHILVSPQPGAVSELTESTNQAWNTVLSTIVFFPPENSRVYRTSAVACPAAADGTKLIIDEGNGFCYLYPADFEISPMMNVWVVGGPVLGNVEGFEDVRVSFAPGLFGAFPGKTPRDLLEMREPTTYDPASVVEMMIGGFPAVIFRDVNGPWPSRQAIINVNGTFYTLVAQPWDPERWPEGIPYLDNLWNTAVTSMQFFTPWR